MKRAKAPFPTEAALVRSGRRTLQKAIVGMGTNVRTRTEVPAPGAVPDLVVFSKEARTVQYVITIEFKLRNWRHALLQAFRHRNFGNEAYVVLDHVRAGGALRKLYEFERANVGLVTLDSEEKVRIWHYPEPRLPFSSQFSRDIARVLLSPRKSIPSDLPFIRTVRGGLALSTLRDTWGGVHFAEATTPENATQAEPV